MNYNPEIIILANKHNLRDKLTQTFFSLGNTVQRQTKRPFFFLFFYTNKESTLTSYTVDSYLQTRKDIFFSFLFAIFFFFYYFGVSGPAEGRVGPCGSVGPGVA